MGADYSDLPAFVFPVFAWSPNVATGQTDDDGTREFRTPWDVVTITAPEPYYQGWTFVDSEGRCWEAVGCRVTNPVQARVIQALSIWFRKAEFRLAFEFVEHPPVTFETVRERLLAAIAANPQFDGFGTGLGRRLQRRLRAAKRFSDLPEPQD